MLLAVIEAVAVWEQQLADRIGVFRIDLAKNDRSLFQHRSCF